MAVFSLVASAWKSTRIILASSPSSTASAVRKGLSVFGSSVKRPWRFTTASGPAGVSKTAQPRPGHWGAKFAGRTTRGSSLR